MTKKLEIYKCADCENIVEVLREGTDGLFCCSKPMVLVTENTVDAAKEKHVPVIEKTADGYKVSVGAVTHPMEEAHHIEWIELLADGIAYRKFLKVGDKPEAVFCVTASQLSAREYCNLHGLWKA